MLKNPDMDSGLLKDLPTVRDMVVTITHQFKRQRKRELPGLREEFV